MRNTTWWPMVQQRIWLKKGDLCSWPKWLGLDFVEMGSIDVELFATLLAWLWANLTLSCPVDSSRSSLDGGTCVCSFGRPDIHVDWLPPLVSTNLTLYVTVASFVKATLGSRGEKWLFVLKDSLLWYNFLEKEMFMQTCWSLELKLHIWSCFNKMWVLDNSEGNWIKASKFVKDTFLYN